MNSVMNILFSNKRKNEVNEARFNEESPIIKINDTNLVVTLGQWMGLLHDSIKTSGNGMSIITQLSAEELLKRKVVSKSDLCAIFQKLSYLFTKLGFGADNTCILDSFDKEKLTFKCTFVETGEVADMKIRFGSFLDECPSLTIKYDKITSKYNYFHETKDKPDRLNLDYIEKEINANKKFIHYISEYRYYGNVYEQDNKVEVEISYPDAITYGSKNNPYLDKELLEEIISSITFPVDIELLVSRITSVLYTDAYLYPEISVAVYKMKDSKKEEITDQVLFIYGEFAKLALTKNGKKITLNKFDQWSYTTDKLSVNQTSMDADKSKFECTYKDVSTQELDQLVMPQIVVGQVKEEIEQVKSLTKTMLQKK